MSELRTDFKDEILQEGETHRVYNIKRKGTDEVVESEVYLEKAYEALQEGDEFGAKDVNEIHVRLNGLASMNLLINSDFRNPINQRGASEISYSDSITRYYIDRWYFIGCYAKVQDNILYVKANRSDGTAYTGQKFENSISGTFTISVNVTYVEQGTLNLYLEGSSGKTSKLSITSSGLHTMIFENVSNMDVLALELLNNFKGNIEYIKLEPGSIATPFVPRLYAEEVALVEYYMMTYQGALGIAHISSTKIAFVTIPCNTRAIPTINEANVILHCSGTNYDGITTMVNVNSDHNTIAIQINGTFPSSIVGQSAFAFMKHGDTLTLDAEIY